MKKFFFALSLLLAMMAAGRTSVWAGTVTVTLERFSLGGDFIMEPTQVEFTEGETYADLLKRVLANRGLSYEANESGGFYLEGIKGVDCGMNIPSCVQAVLDDQGIEVKPNTDDGLYEFSYTSKSGWMYYVNNQYMNGMNLERPREGDAARFMYTLALGADLTGKTQAGMAADGSGLPAKTYYETADKSALVRIMGEANRQRSRWELAEGFSQAYGSACAAMKQMDAPQADVDAATARLEAVRGNLPALKPETMRLSSSALSLYVNGAPVTLTYAFTPQGAVANVSWRSSNPTVATVANGAVTPVGVGETLIAATADNGVEAVCRVTVKELEDKQAFRDGTPTFTAAASAGSIKLTWDAYPNADSYRVLRRKSEGWETLAEISERAYTDAQAVPGEGYFYAVQAVSSKWGAPVESKYNDNTYIMVPLRPETISLSASELILRVNDAPVTLTYAFTPREATANVFWKSSNPTVATVANGAVTPVGVGETLIAATADNGVEAICRVEVKELEDKQAFKDGAPAFTAAASVGSVKLTWDAYPGADGYRVMRRKSIAWEILAEVDGLTYTDAQAFPGESYFYTVQAISSKWGVPMESKYNTNIYVKVPKKDAAVIDPPTVRVGDASLTKAQSAAYNKLTLAWKKAKDADGYQIFRANSQKGNYARIKTIQNVNVTSYTDAGLTTGKTYYYKIRAYKTVNGQMSYGAYSAVKKAKPLPAKPTLTASWAQKKASLKWKKVAGASGYVIYRSVSKEGKYKAVKTIKKAAKTSCADSGLKKGKTFYYKVRAYRAVNGKKVYGAYSQARKVKVK